jgi:putative folate metabolism gamma-glutamate ligase
MQIKTYKTHPITTKDSLFQLIDAYVPKLEERSILIVTSKIVSLCEGRVVGKETVESKQALIQEEADATLEGLTLKNNLFIPFAGIDESNGNGVYILHPKNVQQSASSIWEYVRKRDNIQELGVLITDSHVIPLRRGVTGIGLGWCGFKPLYSYIRKADCFGIPLNITMVNNLDALAAGAVFCMGEGNEQTPFALVLHAPKIEFQSVPPTEAEIRGVSIPMEEDLYAPVLKNPRWKFKNEGVL